MEKYSEKLPIYVRIAEGIKDHILSGDLEEGEQVISTTQLSSEYNISIATVNKTESNFFMNRHLFSIN